MIAVKEDQTSLLDFMLRIGVSPYVYLDGRSLWELAVRWGKPGPVALISKYSNAAPNAGQNQDSAELAPRSTTVHHQIRSHPIWEAMEGGHTPVVLELLNNGNINVNMVDTQQISLLHCAIETENYLLMEPLFSHGANPNTRDWYGWTPLHSAAFRGDVRIVTALRRTLTSTSWISNHGPRWILLCFTGMIRS